MKKIYLLIITLLICYPSFSQKREDTYKLLWKIEGKGIKKASYLFGTMHVNDERAFDFSDSVLVAFQASEVLALEVSTDDYLKHSIANRRKEAPNQMKEELGTEHYNTLRQKILDEAKVDLDQLENANPMLVERLLNRNAGNSNDSRKLDLDNYLFYTAKSLGKEVVGLEKIDAGIRSGKGFDTEMERAYFVKRYIEKKDSLSTFDMDKFLKAFMNSEFNKMMEDYHSGDIETVLSHFENDEMSKFDMIRRNENMAARLDSLMKQSSVFCAVGAGHLAGNKGMIDLLTDLGYQLTPVKATFTGLTKKIQEKLDSAPGYRFEDIPAGFAVQMSGKPLDINLPNTNVMGFIYQDIKNNTIEMLMTVDYPQIFADKEVVIEEMLNNFKSQQKFEVIANEKIMLEGLPGRELTMSHEGTATCKMRYFVKNGKAYIFFYWKLNSEIKIPKKIPFFESIEIYDITDFETLNWRKTDKAQYNINILLPQIFNEFKQEIPLNEAGTDLMINSMINIVDKKQPFSASFQRFKYPPNYEISTNNEFKESFIEATKADQKAELVLDSTFRKGKYEVNTMNYLMQDSISISEVYFSRGNYGYYWTSQYVGTQVPEMKSFLYDWELLPWEEPKFEEYTTNEFSVLIGSELSVEGTYSYDDLLDTLIIHSSLDPNTGSTIRVYQYDFNAFAYFENSDSLIAYFTEPGTTGKLILEQDTVIYNGNGYTTSIFRDSSYNTIEYERIQWKGNKIYFLKIASPLDLDQSFAQEVLQSFQISDSVQFNFFESKLDSILTRIQSEDSSIFQSVKGLLADYPVENKDVHKLKNSLRNGIPLDNDSWNSPGANIISLITELERDSAVHFFDSLFVNNSIYESPILESLQDLNTDLSIQYYRKLLATKTTEVTYWDIYKYRDSTALLLVDLPVIMKLYQKPENQQVISPLLVNHADSNDEVVNALKTYASSFLESFKNTADTINLEDEYNWDYYFLNNLLNLSMVSDNKPKMLKTEFKQLLEAKSPGIKMVGLLGLMYAGEPIKRKLANEVLKHEETADFLLEQIEKTGDQSFISKYLTMETIARIYLKSYLASEDYYEVEVKYLEQFEKQVEDTNYTFYVFSYYDEYSEKDFICFTVFNMQGKTMSLKSVYSDHSIGEYRPEDFAAQKEAIVLDFKTYYVK